jgi:short-subunit dehydrogenase
MSRLAMITGASSGIGEAFAERLAGDGWDLVVVARRRERLEGVADRLVREHGVSVRAVEADLSRPDQLESLGARAAELPLDMLVNNAALAHYMPFAELPPELAGELVGLNVLAPVLLTRAAVPGMVARGRGAIVNVASLLAFSGSWDAPHLPRRAVYAASKSFLVTFTQVLAGELRDSGVRVQVVCPGLVRSEFHTRQGMDLSGVPRMEPGDVVQASLLDLGRGEIVCVPGAPDESARDGVESAQRELVRVTRAVELPQRYRPDVG